MFPQIPVKPLQYVSSPPREERIVFDFARATSAPERPSTKIVSDLVLPAGEGRHPAIMVAIAVLGDESARQTLVGFLKTLGQLGFVVLWPRQEALESGDIKIEEPETFARSIRFLQSLPEVDGGRISIVGFSAGASLALVAAEDETVRGSIRCIVFFAGYYSIESYLSAVATGTMTLNGKTVEWSPDEWIVWFVDQMLSKEDLSVERFRERPAPGSVARLDRLSPDRRIDRLDTHLFILHDLSDRLVPYPESLALRSAVAGRIPVTFHLSDTFQHIQPEAGFSPGAIRELLMLHWFFLQILMVM